MHHVSRFVIMEPTTVSTASIIEDNRFRRIIIFFVRMIWHVIWWDLFVSRIPIIGFRTRQTRSARHRKWAGLFRLMAVEMGGVMIKLGQFLSARVDVLPKEITDELKGLQDEVPAVPWDQIHAILRSDLGNLDNRFSLIEEEPIAAASLGQAHRAWLVPDSDNQERGAPVVVKVQRPRIENMVRTDLAALQIVARILMRYPPIRRRADVPALLEEFSRTLWEELDYESEANNVERFTQIHALDPRIYIPAVYRQHSTRRVLVLENVETLKVGDIAAQINVGIDPKAVANVLLEAYFKQVFEEGFFHADPHPGNLFVRPLPGWEGEPGTRPFLLIFVDFGMVGHIPSLMGDNLRKVMIGIMQRDARQLTEAYQDMGFLLPGADIERIVEAQSTVLDHIWGRKLLDISRPDPKEVQAITSEYRDLLFDFPFQIPQDFIYLGRAFGMVMGLVSQLDPEINAWHQVEKYGRRLAGLQGGEDIREVSREMILQGIRPYLEMPPRILRLLEMAEKGRIVVQNKPEPAEARRQEKIEKRLGQLSWSILGAAGMISASLFFFLSRQNKQKD
ncbi:MAG: AarF/UbiB family protein [Candidatus Promineifilaceae bacterium]|nr:AarF/UbiB family protein [Candidatus Promineifilaceae bacterium]